MSENDQSGSSEQQQRRQRQQQQHRQQQQNHQNLPGNGPGPGGAYPFPNWGGDDRDNDSFRYLSEPSLSEECDSSTADRRSLLSPTSDDDDDEEDEELGDSTPPPPPPGPPPPLNNSAASSGIQSPGNTSLSSRESHFPPQNSQFVKIHFSPDSERNQYYYPQYRHMQQLFQPQYYQGQQQQPQMLAPMNSRQQEGPPNNGPSQTTTALAPSPSSNNDQNGAAQAGEEENPNNLSYSSFSFSTLSSVSTKERKQLDEFISDLRQNSEGALQETEANNSLLNTSTDSSQPKATLDTVLRSSAAEETQDKEHAVPARHRRISSVDTELIGNTSDVHDLEDTDDKLAETASMVMNLSESEDEEENNGGATTETTTELRNDKIDRISEKDSNSQSSSMKEDGAKGSSRSTGNNSGGAQLSESNHTSTEEDPHQHSADDEQTAIRAPRKRVFNIAGGKPSPAHRRTRSGDSAAAALATGGMDWRGMDKDKIPLPIADDDDDDDDEEEDEGCKGETSQNNPITTSSSKARNGKKPNNNNETAVFSMGASEAAAASRAAARRQRREQRQEQRVVAEKAAAAAKERRIKQQYQEFSNASPWGYNEQQRYRVDSLDQSLGSIPSTILHAAEDQSHADDERPKPRLSIDTKSSNITSSTGDFPGMNESMFSWISTSQHGSTAGNDPSLSPSPYSRRRSLQVPPQWLQQQVGSPPLPGRHKRASTTMIPAYAQAETPFQGDDSFRRYLLQQSQSHDMHESYQRVPRQYPSPESYGSYGARSAPGQALMSSLSHDSYHSPVWSNANNYGRPTSHSSHSSGSSNSSESSSTHSSEEDDEFMDIHQNRLHEMRPSRFSSLNAMEQSVEDALLQRGTLQHVVRHAKSSPSGMQNSDTASSTKFDKASFLPKTSMLQQEGEQQYPTYRCPRCQTIQREFFTVSSAPGQSDSASRYLALYFAIYVIASLYIFGMEENWPAIDCIYFAVITLTTAGLGDFVPTSDGNKIICSIFIYFGVACIGLLLGTYIAEMLDETSRRQSKENRLKSCPNCARIQNIKDAVERRRVPMRRSSVSPGGQAIPPALFSSERPSHISEHSHGFGSDPALLSPTRAALDLHVDHAHKKVKRDHESHSSRSPGSAENTLSPTKLTTQSVPEARRSLNGNPSNQTSIAFSPTSYMSPSVTNRKSPSPSLPATIPESSSELADPGEVIDENNPQASPGTKSQDTSPRPPPPPPPFPREDTEAQNDQGNPTPGRRFSPSPNSPHSAGFPAGSPMTKQILGRQSHTRHTSIDINGGYLFQPGSQAKSARRFSLDGPSYLPPSISENVPSEPGNAASAHYQSARLARQSVPNFNPSSMQFDSFLSGSDDDDSSVTSSSESYSDDSDFFDQMAKDRFKTLKYIFLTLRQALVNSLVIIGVGCLGFWFIERFSFIDSWYFTTVLLTTVGYGDIAPVTKGGKLFATIYILVAGTILLNNMSLISMIPLELRKRRIEEAVLTQFGDSLDDDALRELAAGPLIQRLRLSVNRPDGLDECTREMFALAMLVRLGKVTEEDILETFAAFHRLDVNNDGVLNSRSIIAGMINKRRNQANQMRRVASTNSMLKRTQGQSTPLYPGRGGATGSDGDYGGSGLNGMDPPSFWTPTPTPPVYQPVNNPESFAMGFNPAVTTETSSLLGSGGGGYGTRHKRGKSAGNLA